MWYRGHKNFKPKWLILKYWELQNKHKFIKFESQEVEINLRVSKILIIYIIKRFWIDLKSIFEKAFMGEF